LDLWLKFKGLIDQVVVQNVIADIEEEELIEADESNDDDILPSEPVYPIGLEQRVDAMEKLLADIHQTLNAYHLGLK